MWYPRSRLWYVLGYWGLLAGGGGVVFCLGTSGGSGFSAYGGGAGLLRFGGLGVFD